MAARRAAGMSYHAIVRSRTDPHDFLAVMVWPDQESYEAWHGSPERARLFADQPHYMVREPTRRYTVVSQEQPLPTGPS
jgi:quinol monooxygenase YgiN